MFQGTFTVLLRTWHSVTPQTSSWVLAKVTLQRSVRWGPWLPEWNLLQHHTTEYQRGYPVGACRDVHWVFTGLVRTCDPVTPQASPQALPGRKVGHPKASMGGRPWFKLTPTPHHRVGWVSKGVSGEGLPAACSTARCPTGRTGAWGTAAGAAPRGRRECQTAPDD